MLMLKSLVVLVATLGGFGLFAFNVRKLVRQVLLGRAENLWDHVAARTGNVLKYVFGHAKVMEDPGAGLMHMVFFYGFLILQLGHGEHVVSGMTQGFFTTGFEFKHILPTPAYHLFLLSQDVLAGLVVLVTVYSLCRRWFHLVPRLDPRSADAEIILSFIGALYLTFFLYTTTDVAAGGDSGWFRPFATPLGLALADLLGDKGPPVIHVLHELGYWAHLTVFLSFVNYLPYSKHAHTMAALPNIFFHREGARGKPSIIDFEKAEVYGVTAVGGLSWKDLLDGYACTECGRCNAVCPAHLTGKPLQPRKVIHDIKENLQHNAPAFGAAPSAGGGEGAPQALALINKDAVAHHGATGPITVDAQGRYSTHGTIHVDEAWACTTCGACMEVCPVLIESVPATLMEIRRNQVMMESDFPPEMAATFKNLEGQGNPWGVPQTEREKWAEGLNVPLMRDKKEVDVLLWVGCAGATDDRAVRTQKALVEVMKAANVNYAILGCEEKCTGDPARRMGNEYVFQNLCTENQAVLKQYKFKEIVTSCPHCLNSLGNEYSDYGAPKWKVRHHSQLLSELLEKALLPLKEETGPKEKVTFHDPCYLGRYNHTYEEPRHALRVLNNVELVEMDRTKEKSFCCGAGGGRVFMEEHLGKRVNVERTEQAMATGAQTVAVGCPFCMTMITDGTKAKGVEEQVAVKDIAEMVAARLRPAAALAKM